MKVLTIGAQKGGAGKSTTAVHLAVQAALDGRRTMIVDLDVQGSVASWAERRAADDPLVVRSSPGQLPEILELARSEGMDLVVLDTPPHTGGTIDVAFSRADLVVVPIRPGPFDIDAASATIDVLRSSGRPGVFLLSQVPPRGSEADDTASLLEDLYPDMQVLEARVTTRKAFMQALIEGRAVREFEPPSSKAVAEIQALYDEIMRRIS